MSEINLKFSSSTMERYIAAYVIRNRSFYLKVGKFLKTSDFIKKSYFTDSKLQWLVNTANVYYDKYDRLPSIDVYKMFIEKKFKDDPLLTKSMNTVVDEICNLDLSSVEEEFIQEETISFIKKNRAVEATLLNQIDITNGKYDKLSDRMVDAVNINLDKDFGISLKDTKATMSLLREAEEDTGLTYGSPSLDRVLGCPKPSELFVIGGTPGVGKTIWLGNIATENMKLGKKGVFFSLEVDKKRLSKRLYSSLLMKNGIDVLNSTEEEIEAVFSSFKGGDIRIKNYPANSACCNDFAAYLNDLYTIEGFKPDFIVIDYILITATNGKRDNENSYSYYKVVSEEMRNLAIQFNCPVFSAIQMNRSAISDKSGGTKAVVTAKDIAESKGVLDTADYCLIINQSDQEKAMGEKDGISEQRLFVAKNRNGKTGDMLPFVLDYNTMSITDGKKKSNKLTLRS